MRFIKKNIISILCFLFLIIWTTIMTIVNYQHYDLYEYQKSHERCQSDREFYELRKESCDELATYDHLTADTFSVFHNILTSYEGSSSLIFILPLFVILPAVWHNQKEVKSNFAKNYLTRSSYKAYMKRFLKQAYKACWVLPAYVLYVFVLSFIISGHFDYRLFINYSLDTFDLQFLKLGVFFIVVFIINVAIHSLLYINLALICIKKNKHIILTILETYLLWIGIEIIAEVINSDLIKYGIVDGNYFGFLNIINIYGLEGKPEAWLMLVISLLYLGLSVVILWLVYKNKEKTLICWEK